MLGFVYPKLNIINLLLQGVRDAFGAYDVFFIYNKLGNFAINLWLRQKQAYIYLLIRVYILICVTPNWQAQICNRHEILCLILQLVDSNASYYIMIPELLDNKLF